MATSAAVAVAYNQFSNRLWLGMQKYDATNGYSGDVCNLVETQQGDVYKHLTEVNISGLIPHNIRRLLSFDWATETIAYVLIETFDYGDLDDLTWFQTEIWEINTSEATAKFIHRFTIQLCSELWANNSGISIKDDRIYVTKNPGSGTTEEAILYLEQTPYIYDDPEDELRYKHYKWTEYAHVGDDDLTITNPIGLDWYGDELYVATASGPGNELYSLYDKYVIGQYDTHFPNARINDITLDGSGDVWITYWQVVDGEMKWWLGHIREVIPRRTLRQVGELRATEYKTPNRFPVKYCDACDTLDTSYSKRCRSCGQDITLGRRWYVLHIGYDNVDVMLLEPSYIDYVNIGSGRILIDAATVENMKLKEIIKISYEINDAFTVAYVDDYIDNTSSDRELIEEEWTIRLSDVEKNILVTYEAGYDEYHQSDLIVNPMITGENRMFTYADYQKRAPVKLELHASPYTIRDSVTIVARVLDSHDNPIPDQVVGYRFYRIAFDDNNIRPIRTGHEFIPILDPANLSPGTDGVGDNCPRDGYSIHHPTNPTNDIGKATCVLTRHHIYGRDYDYRGHVLVVAETEDLQTYMLLQDPESSDKVAINDLTVANLVRSNYRVGE
jgi:hypothetical protein